MQAVDLADLRIVKSEANIGIKKESPRFPRRRINRIHVVRRSSFSFYGATDWILALTLPVLRERLNSAAAEGSPLE